MGISSGPESNMSSYEKSRLEVVRKALKTEEEDPVWLGRNVNVQIVPVEYFVSCLGLISACSLHF